MRRDGISALAVGMSAGAVVFLPVGAATVGTVLTDWRLALAVCGVAVLSSVVPYVIEQVVLRRVPAARFAILLAMLPVTAVIIGAVVLAQLPTIAELGGIVLVCVAIVLSAQRPAGSTGAEGSGRRPATTGRAARSRRCRELGLAQPRLFVSNVLQEAGSPDW